MIGRVFPQPILIECFRDVNHGNFWAEFTLTIAPGIHHLECHLYWHGGRHRVGFPQNEARKSLMAFASKEIYDQAEREVLAALAEQGYLRNGQ